jgi:Tfp pilus assembly protein PilF
MKKTLFSRLLAPAVALALTFGMAPVQLMAQDSKIETGIVAFQNQDYKKAVEALKIGLSNQAEVKPKNLPRGYYHLGLASIQLMQQTVAAGNVEANAAAISALLDQAYDSFVQARKTDGEAKWTEKVNKQLNGLNFSFLNAGMTALNMTTGDKMTAAEKQEAYVEVEKYTGRCIEIDPTNYMSYDLRGQARLAKKDTANAYTDFQTALSKFESNAPENPDIFIAYTAWRVALVERYNKANLDGALAAIEKGKALLEKEHSRVIVAKDKYKPEQLAKIEEQYAGAQQDLGNFELDILLNSPGKLQQALGKFEAAIKNDPKNYILYVAYAQLLEKVDVPKAATVYEEATKVDPTKPLAFFNLGALYVNQGVQKYKDANKEEKNLAKAKELQQEGDNLYRKALPLLAKSLELQPCDSESLQGILNICINLSADPAMAADYDKYKKIKADCGK